MKRKVCYKITVPHQHTVTLIQTGKDRFTVQYGRLKKPSLDYAEAAYELGRSIMHAVACNGQIED